MTYDLDNRNRDRVLDDSREEREADYLYFGRAYCVTCRSYREVVEVDPQVTVYEGLRELTYEVKFLACGHQRERLLDDVRAGF